MVKIIGDKPEEVMVLRVVGELPGSTVLAAAQPSADHRQVAVDVGGSKVESR